MALPVTQWRFHDASKIDGSSQEYYYALVNLNAKNTDFKLKQGKIIGYQKYLNPK